MELNLQNIPEIISLKGDYEYRKVFINGKHLSPAASLKVWNHSPDGFNWGYGGSGPAQLSLAICLLFLPKKDAVALYQDFKFKVIAALPQSDFDTVIELREEFKKILEKREAK